MKLDKMPQFYCLLVTLKNQWKIWRTPLQSRNAAMRQAFPTLNLLTNLEQMAVYRIEWNKPGAKDFRRIPAVDAARSVGAVNSPTVKRRAGSGLAISG